MNELIRDIAIEAGLIAPYGSDHEGLRDFDYRKFAELLIKECIRIAHETDNVQPKTYAFIEIGKHFGIDYET